MISSNTVFLLLIGLIAANQLVMRLGALRSRAAVFWSLQAVNILVMTYVLGWGLPGFERWPVVHWLIGLLVMLRIIQNNGLRAQFVREQRAQSPAPSTSSGSATIPPTTE